MRILAWPAYKNRIEQPYNSLLYSHIAHRGVKVDEFSPLRLLFQKYDVWHLHWPDWLLNESSAVGAFAKAQILLNLMDWARWRGTKAVWTVHNLRAHEQLYPKLEFWFWRAFTRRLDAYISLSNTGMDAAQEAFPSLKSIPGFVVPLGHFRGVYPDTLSRDQARSLLGIAPLSRVLLFIGTVRPYKNVPQLLRAFRDVADQGIMLYIAGRPNSLELLELVKQEAAFDPRVRYELCFIPHARVQVYMRAADLVVLPFREILNSSSALLAPPFDRPVLVPQQGALGELQSKVGDEWVRTYVSEITAYQIEEAIEWALNASRAQKVRLNTLDWPELAQHTIDAYRRLVSG